MVSYPPFLHVSFLLLGLIPLCRPIVGAFTKAAIVGQTRVEGISKLPRPRELGFGVSSPSAGGLYPRRALAYPWPVPPLRHGLSAFTGALNHRLYLGFRGKVTSPHLPVKKFLYPTPRPHGRSLRCIAMKATLGSISKTGWVTCPSKRV